MTTYRIFLSSPGDVRPERDRVEAVVARLNAELGPATRLELTRWEKSYYLATASFQEQISHPSDHDLAIFVFWKTLGSELPPAYNRPDGTSRTGTEYEFEEAREGRERRNDGTPDILVYRKTAPVFYSEATVEQERAEKKALDGFWNKWFRSDSGHFVAGFQSFRDTEDLARQFDQHLRSWLKRRSAVAEWDITRDGNPFRGLDAFDEAHSQVFFGRDDDVRRVRARLIEAAIGHEPGRPGLPVLFILGASGSGKSSLLRAGVVPALCSGVPGVSDDGSDALDGFRTLTVAGRDLGEDPVRGLFRALYAVPSAGRSAAGLPELREGDYPDADGLAAVVRDSAAAAVQPILRALHRAAASGGHSGADVLRPLRLGLLLAVDQAEELFSLSADSRAAFARLLEAMLRTGRVWVVATMRNDFYGRLRADPPLNALVDARHTYDLEAPSAADYRSIIRRPAAMANLVFEADGQRDLAKEIESEAMSEGSLPMIEFLLARLFEERCGNLLTLAAYDRCGGAAGVLARSGEDILGRLDGEARESLPRLVRRLVRRSARKQSPTARTVPIDAFPEGTPDRRLIEALREGRLVQSFLAAQTDAEAPIVSVRFAHEALLTRWPRIAELIEASGQDYETLDRIEQAYALWRQTPAVRRDARLLTDFALLEAVELVQRWGDDIDVSVREFVAAARRRAERRRLRRWAAVVAGVGVAAIVGAIAMRLLGTGKQDAGPGATADRALPIVSVQAPRNLTGDQQLDWLGVGVAGLVRDEIARSRFLIVAADEEADPPADRPTATRPGALSPHFSHVLSGEFLGGPGSLILTVRLRDVATGKTVAADRFEQPTPQRLIGIAPSVATLVKRGLGVPPSEQVDVFAADFASKHLPAYESYIDGLRAFLGFEYEKARAAFEKALQADPRFAMARYRLAHTLAVLGETSAAIGELDRAAGDAADLPDRERRYIDALAAYLARDYVEAERRYTALLQDYPYDVEARQLLIYIEYDLEKYQQALDHARALAVQKPQSEVVWGAISELNLKLRRFTDADVALERYMEIAPANANMHFLHGEADFLRGNVAEARAHYEKAFAVNPAMGASKMRLAQLDAITGNDALAAMPGLADLADDPRVSPSDRLDAVFELAHLERAAGHCDRAVALLEQRAGAIDQEGAGMALALAIRSRCALDTGRVADARRLAQQAVDNPIGSPARYLVARGLAEVEARDYEAAGATIEALRVLAATSPTGNSPEERASAFLSGVRSLAEGQVNAAVPALAKAVTGAGYAYELYDLWYARALIAAGDPQRAEQVLRTALTNTDRAEPRFDLEFSRRQAGTLLSDVLKDSGRGS